MSQTQTSTAFEEVYKSAKAAPAEARAAFMRRTYAHLALAILALVTIETLLFMSGIHLKFLNVLMKSGYIWLGIIIAFGLLGSMMRGVASRIESKSAQYGALFGYVVLQAIILCPLLTIAAYFVGNDSTNGQLTITATGMALISQAGIMTLALFAGLTTVVLTSRKDFSFLRGALTIAGMGAMALVICAIIFGITLGTWFSVAMIVLAGGMILYDTSRILHHYPTNRHVAASIELFASIALLFFYMLRLLMTLNRD